MIFIVYFSEGRWIQRKRWLGRNWIQDVGGLQDWKKEFLLVTEAEQECFEEEVDSEMEGGESFDKMNGLFSTEDIDYGRSPPWK